MSAGQGGPTSGPTPKIFICYRREDTAAHAGRLYDAMVARFGEANVFMDVDLEPGVDFVDRITNVVSSCHVLIVVMGPSWATVKDQQGDVRIADPEDFVRLEVETALRRPDVTPIPVLVSGARMPSREDLPEGVRAITRRNALELSEARWRYDVGRLNSTLDQLLVEMSRTDRAVPVPKPSAPSPLSGRLILEGMLVGGVAAYGARWLGELIYKSTDTTAEAIVGVILRRGETWALVGAALAVWLAIRTRGADRLRLGVRGLLVGAVAGAVGGAIWALPVYLPDPNLSDNVADWIEVGSTAVTGGLIGALIGALWLPPRVSAGLASGVGAGALIQLLLNQAAGWDVNTSSEQALFFGIRSAAIAGVTISTLLALDRRRSGAETAASVRGDEP